jgi:hypothetical protein
LKISQPHDAAEIEADQIADRVMRTEHHGQHAATLSTRYSSDQTQPSIRRKQLPGGGSSSYFGQAHIRNAMSSGGKSLTGEVRGFFEPRFGYDLGDVRIHTGDSADRSARALDAEAYTVGRDIVFSGGAFAPDTSRGRRLIAHELAHVTQGAGVGHGVISRSPAASEDVWGFRVTGAMCGCQPALRDAIDWANTAAGTYATCDTPANTTSTAVEACFDAAHPTAVVAGSTSSSGTMTLPPPTADPCESIMNRATFVHETMHSRHTDSIARRQGWRFFAEWRRLAGNPNRLSLLRATFPTEVAAFETQWHDGHDWAQDEVNSYRWERRFMEAALRALGRICS